MEARGGHTRGPPRALLRNFEMGGFLEHLSMLSNASVFVEVRGGHTRGLP